MSSQGLYLLGLGLGLGVTGRGGLGGFTWLGLRTGRVRGLYLVRVTYGQG